MDKIILIPPNLKEQIIPLKNHYPRKVNLITFDTETERGLPYFLTFYNGEKITYFKVASQDILDIFLEYLSKHCSKHTRFAK